MQTAIDRIENHVAKAKRSKDPAVRPGRPERFTAAAQAGDTIPQGDCYLMIVDSVPDGYATVSKPTDADRQLVPGNTIGAKHCLDSLEGVTLYRRENWQQLAEEDFLGPCFTLEAERVVEHPTHGNVTIPAGFTVLIGYQPNWDAVAQRERRNAD